MLDALWARFGLTTREAQTKLTALKRAYSTSLMEHSVEVERLVNIAYADLTDRQRQDMALDQFASTLGHVALQRHPLAVQPVDLAPMVRAGNEYLSLQVTQARIGRIQQFKSHEPWSYRHHTRAKPGPPRVQALRSEKV